MGAWRAWAAAMLMLAAGAVPVRAADDGTLTFRVKSNYPYRVELEFYSDDRFAAWPGDGQVYYIDDWEVHSYVLACRVGETICFGAWVPGDAESFWGVGPDNTEWCERCCYDCAAGGAVTRIITLEP